MHLLFEQRREGSPQWPVTSTVKDGSILNISRTRDVSYDNMHVHQKRLQHLTLIHLCEMPG